MARSASVDPIEKFRFQVTVLNLDLSVTGAIQSLANLLPESIKSSTAGSLLSSFNFVMTRAGFSEITSPKLTINEINYRENIDNQRFVKIPGLVRFQPITLSRGVTQSIDLYNWYSAVNYDQAMGAVASQLNAQSVVGPRQSPVFRRDIVLEALDREGNVEKVWLLFNSFPIAYNTGNDFNAAADGEKLIESITITYEYFIEGASIAQILETAVIQGVATAALSTFAPPAIQQLF